MNFLFDVFGVSSGALIERGIITKVFINNRYSVIIGGIEYSNVLIEKRPGEKVVFMNLGGPATGFIEKNRYTIGQVVQIVKIQGNPNRRVITGLDPTGPYNFELVEI